MAAEGGKADSDMTSLTRLRPDTTGHNLVVKVRPTLLPPRPPGSPSHRSLPHSHGVSPPCAHGPYTRTHVLSARAMKPTAVPLAATAAGAGEQAGADAAGRRRRQGRCPGATRLRVSRG